MAREVEGIVVANAPISYGAFELTVGIDPNVPDASMVLDEVSAAGYAGPIEVEIFNQILWNSDPDEAFSKICKAFLEAV